MPSMLHSKASLGGIPSPGTTCSKAWNKVFQILEQVIEGTPLFEPLKITVLQLQFQFLTSSKSLTLDRLQTGLVCTRLNAIFSFFASDDDDSDDSGGIYFSNGSVVSYLFIMIK